MSESARAPTGLYPILGDAHFTPAELPEAAAALAALGVGTLQLRLKSLADGACFEVQRSVARRLARWPGTLVVNDRADLAHLLWREARDAGHAHRVGLHLGQTDLPARAARAIVGPEVAIGLSTHTLEQLRAGLDEPVDHLAFGPIFDTATKDRPDPTVGLSLLREAAAIAARRSFGVVAIGGIDEARAAEVLRHGACAVAVIGALSKDGLAGLEARALSLLTAIRSAA